MHTPPPLLTGDARTTAMAEAHHRSQALLCVSPPFKWFGWPMGYLPPPPSKEPPCPMNGECTNRRVCHFSQQCRCPYNPCRLNVPRPVLDCHFGVHGCAGTQGGWGRETLPHIGSTVMSQPNAARLRALFFRNRGLYLKVGSLGLLFQTLGWFSPVLTSDLFMKRFIL